MLYTKITRDNVDTLFELLTDRKLVTEEQVSDRFFHIGKFVYVKNKVSVVTVDEPKGTQVLLPKLSLNVTAVDIEYTTHNLLNKDYSYHLYQCRDGINIWHDNRIEAGDIITIGKHKYKLYPTQERMTFPVKAMNNYRWYYEFRIREVKSC